MKRMLTMLLAAILAICASAAQAEEAPYLDYDAASGTFTDIAHEWTCETKPFVWVFEFNFNKSANAAVRQIREKDYASAYKGDMRPVTLVGINFRTSKRNIEEPMFAKMRG